MWAAVKAIPRVPRLEAEEFREEYVKPGLPVIVERVACEWPAARLWTLDFLCDQIQSLHHNLPVATWAPPQESLSSFRRSRMPVSEYVANMRRGDFTWHGSNGWKLRVFPALQEHVETPAFIGERVIGRNLWFSGPGAKTPTHYDSGSPYGVNAQVKGSKRFRLVSGEHLMDMYPVPGGNYSHVCNLMKPDFERFPRLRHVTCWEGVLSEGDALFIPANWFHYVEHLGQFNVNVQFWFGHPLLLRPKREVRPIVIRDAIVSWMSPYNFGEPVAHKTLLQRIGVPEAVDSLVLLPLAEHFPSLLTASCGPLLRRIVMRRLALKGNQTGVLN